MLGKVNEVDEILNIKIEIIKHIVGVKLDEADKRAKQTALREQKQKIMEVLADKQSQDLQNKSVEELMAMLNELN